MKSPIILFSMLLIYHHNVWANHQNPLFNNPLTTPITFKDIRDHQVSKQDIDYSCGASSLSTILTYFYKTPKTEQQILADMKLDGIMASFLDLMVVVSHYGFDGRGLLMDYQSLSQIKIPVIVYVNHKRSDHFSVVRAIDEKHVYLSDSSWGNRTLTRRQFEKMWLTHSDGTQGRVLIILPLTEVQKQHTNTNFVKIQDTQKLLRQSPELFRAFL